MGSSLISKVLFWLLATSLVVAAYFLLLPMLMGPSYEQLKIGAQVYADRCVLCHGNYGMGDGTLALNIKNYPDTNLMVKVNYTGRGEIAEVVKKGGYHIKDMSDKMPPWMDELSEKDISAVADFIVYLRKEKEAAINMLRLYSVNGVAKRIGAGKSIFKSRCALCHGFSGRGDGKMAKVITSPPPFNLTKSVVPYSYLRMIIERGGQGVNRSYRMPPWKDELTSAEIDAVIEYIMTLRTDEK